jgi:pantetheine-phosphate adenylyltransferase
MKKAVFPGTFDPVTLGHTDILHRTLPLFDTIYVVIGLNFNKKPLFPVEQRIKWLQECFRNEPKIEICSFSGLTADFCKANDVSYIIRGIRNLMDYQYEKDIARANLDLRPGLETIYIHCSPQWAHLSSSLVRELYQHHSNIQQYLPDCVTL